MFYYYGRKKQIAKWYPAPTYGTIVEPFAGSAAYSMHSANWNKAVILVEKDQRVAEIWRWLIEKATPKEILSVPELKVGEKSSEFLHIIHAATKMAFKYKTIKVTPVLERNWEISRRVMAANVHKVKHWKITNGNYDIVPNETATWFIDPPYISNSGAGYNCSNSDIRYDLLAQWIRGRKGQVICCEGAGATYLPFRPLLSLPGVAGKRNSELIYSRDEDARLTRDLFTDLLAEA